MQAPPPPLPPLAWRWETLARPSRDTKTAVMSSQYSPSFSFHCSRAACSNNSRASRCVLPAAKASSTIEATVSVERNSQTPSLAASTKASCRYFLVSQTTTSGSAITPQSLTDRSPRERDMLMPGYSWPLRLTRQSTNPSSCCVIVTSPPISSIRFASPSSMGLWSLVSATAPLPGTNSTARESPAVPTQSLEDPLFHMTVTAVQPLACMSTCSLRALETKSFCTWSKAKIKAASTWSFLSICVTFSL
mmetsp:Transcript_65158/g.168133  ORF Transcript_65158/g.168133 Transcript_65158/m.168133 type:complete len:248 (+) Transcript_65158:159-902(+)